MRLRFQADADLHPQIGLGLRRLNSNIDFQLAQGIIADATPDPEVLQFAAEEGRVLVSRDTCTMRKHFANFISARSSPGLILIPSRMSLGDAIRKLYIA